MQRFRYIAYDGHGHRESGYIEAASRDAAVLLVKKRGLQPTAIYGPYGHAPGAGRFNISRVRVKSLSAYTRKFQQLYKAGMGIDEVFQVLGEQEDVRYLREVSMKLAGDVREGLDIEEALKRYPLVFPPLFVALFKTGIDSGNLDVVAERLATLYEKESALRTQMWSKFAYPIGMVIITLLFSMLLVRLGGIQRSVSVGLFTFWGIFIAIVIFFCTPVGYPMLRAVLRQTPYIGQVMLKTNMSRFCRVLGMLYASGMPLFEALEHTEQTLQDPRLSTRIERIKALVNEGHDLATSMDIAGLIPRQVISMVAVGERGGDIEAMLEKMSAYYDIEIDHQQHVLVVVGYFVAYAMMAITAGIIIISFWAGYYHQIGALLDE